jgi:hypothetical protein
MGMSCKARCWKIALMVLVGIAVMGLVVMLLWNWLVPTLFAGKEIGYLQALGILVLSKLLFGGFRGRGCHGRWHRHRWENMSPEEREKFRAGLHGCCGGKYDQDESGGLKEPQN